MSGNPITSNGTANRSVSRLSNMRAQFQQKQMAEKQAKLMNMLDNQQQKLIQHTNGYLNKYNNNTAVQPPAAAPLPPGKVRQMFEERRKGGVTSASSTSAPPVKGIDKSYPLDPLVTPPLSKTTNRTASSSSYTTTRTVGTKKPAGQVAPLPASITRPSNLGSSKKPLPSPPTSTTPVSLHPSSKPVTPTQSLPPSRGSMNRSSASSHTSASSSSGGSARSATSNSTYPPPISSTTKYSEYASELEKMETTLSNKLKGMEINGSTSNTAGAAKKPLRNPPLVNGNSKVIGSSRTPPVGNKSPEKSPSPTRPKGPPPPGLEGCKMCGRYFAPDRIVKHESICKKVSIKKKRKVFDPTKMRMEGTEAEPYIRVVSAKPKVPPKAKPQAKKADWRKKHEEFIATIRAAKEYQVHVAKGGNPADIPPPPPTDTSDYIQCQHCGRKFSEAAAERHIPKCKNIRSNKR